MEEYTNDFAKWGIMLNWLKTEKFAFALLTMDDPSNKSIVEQLNITSATLVLVQFDGKEEKEDNCPERLLGILSG